MLETFRAEHGDKFVGRLSSRNHIRAILQR